MSKYLDNSPLVEQVVFQQSEQVRMTTTKQYDFLNRLTRIASANGQGSPLDGGTFRYGYNAANQRVGLTNSDNSYWDYRYDALGQVTNGWKYTQEGAGIPDRQYAYFFDDIGNRTQTVTNGFPKSYHANLLNQYDNQPETYVPDPDGNLIQDAKWIYTWDGENRLIALDSQPGVTPARRLECSYDSQGRRIRKLVKDGQGTVISDNRFVYDGWNLIATFNSELSILQSYMWGLDLSGSEQGAGGVGGLLAIRNQSGSVHFPVYDGNGNVMLLISAADSSESARYEYGPFGELLSAGGTMAYVNPIRFSTKYQDDETSFFYYGFRYYSPLAGRWLSRDPLEEIGGVNLYDFVNDSPTVHMDNYGLLKIPWQKIVKSLPLPPDYIQKIHAFLIAKLVTPLVFKYTVTIDVDCPKGSSRHLLTETNDYEEKIQSVYIYLVPVNANLLSFEVYVPIKQIVKQVYGCCEDCWGFDTKSWHKSKDENYVPELKDELDLKLVRVGTSIQKHTVVKKRWRECKKDVAPIRTWTDFTFPPL